MAPWWPVWATINHPHLVFLVHHLFESCLSLSQESIAKELQELRDCYIATQGRPDIAGAVSLNQVAPADAKVENIVELNKTAKYVREYADLAIRVKKIDIDKLMFVVYSDSGLGNAL